VSKERPQGPTRRRVERQAQGLEPPCASTGSSTLCRTRSNIPERGMSTFVVAEGCSGRQRPKGRSRPLGCRLALKQLACERAQSRIRGRRVGSRAVVGAKPAHEGAGSRLRETGSIAQEALESVRGVTATRPRCCVFVRSPSRWAQGVRGLRVSAPQQKSCPRSMTAGPEPRAARRNGSSAARAKNPGISSRVTAARTVVPRRESDDGR
jgi:hypothetical protein